MPLLEKETIITLINEFQNSSLDIVIPKDTKGNTHNLCGVFHISLLPTIQSLLTNNIHKINTLIETSHSKTIEFQNADQFVNLNTPNEYQNILNK